MMSKDSAVALAFLSFVGLLIILLLTRRAGGQWPEFETRPIIFHAAYEIPEEFGLTPCTYDDRDIDLTHSRTGPETITIECTQDMPEARLTVTYVDGDNEREGIMAVNDIEYGLFGERRVECDIEQSGAPSCDFTYDIILHAGSNPITWTKSATIGYRVEGLRLEVGASRANHAYMLVDDPDEPSIVYCQAWSNENGLVQCEAPWEAFEKGNHWIRYGEVRPDER